MSPLSVWLNMTGCTRPSGGFAAEACWCCKSHWHSTGGPAGDSTMQGWKAGLSLVVSLVGSCVVRWVW
eukprot:2317226-Amphidinium_carterae.1